MHREDIKARLRKKYGSVLAFERAVGLPARSAHDTLRGRASANAELAIAAALKLPVHKLFPRHRTARRRLISSASADNMSAEPSVHRLSSGVR